MLGLGMTAQAASGAFALGAPFLLPALHTQGLSLGSAGVIVTMPSFGIMATLIAWGALTDAIGERVVLAVGMIGTALAAVGAALTASSHFWLGAFLFLAGAASASANAASGRVVVGWFPADRRGLVMGLRQMAQPLGTALAALTMPVIAESRGVSAALWVPLVLAGLAGLGCWWGVVDPPRPPRAQASAELLTNPYRASRLLWRIHAVSVLLVAPQFLVSSFALVWLQEDRHFAAASAGVLITVAQVLGAIGRVAVGHLSDRVGSRMRPLRWVAAAAGLTMAALALTDWWHSSAADVLIVVATVVTVADNGLAFTSVAEIGGPFWSGRALGVQNTAQYLAGSAVVPLAGVAVGLIGFPWTFAAAALFPALALPLIPPDAPASSTASGPTSGPATPRTT